MLRDTSESWGSEMEWIEEDETSGEERVHNTLEFQGYDERRAPVFIRGIRIGLGEPLSEETEHTRALSERSRTSPVAPGRCERCQGLLVADGYMGWAQRCIQCGNVVDETIRRNRSGIQVPHGHKEPRRYSIPATW
ncbi:MAG: hypothetical protein U0172_01765 [Nitrospiraceae bacterium]